MRLWIPWCRFGANFPHAAFLSFHLILHKPQQQAEALISASQSLMSSSKLKTLFEVVLAFGNYMNSQRKGSVYGFKLSAFERVHLH